MYVSCRSSGVWGVVGRVSGHKYVEDIVQNEMLLILQLLGEDTAKRSPGAVSTHVVRVTIDQEMEELAEAKGENESFVWRLNRFKVSLRTGETKREKEQLKISPLPR